jgi:hypothetical protein
LDAFSTKGKEDTSCQIQIITDENRVATHNQNGYLPQRVGLFSISSVNPGLFGNGVSKTNRLPMIAQEAQKKELTLSHPKRAKIENSADEVYLPEEAHPADVADYLASMLEGSQELASKNGMVLLAYLIQVAAEEARIQAAAARDGSD